MFIRKIHINAIRINGQNDIPVHLKDTIKIDGDKIVCLSAEGYNESPLGSVIGFDMEAPTETGKGAWHMGEGSYRIVNGEICPALEIRTAEKIEPPFSLETQYGTETLKEGQEGYLVTCPDGSQNILTIGTSSAKNYMVCDRKGADLYPLYAYDGIDDYANDVIRELKNGVPSPYQGCWAQEPIKEPPQQGDFKKEVNGILQLAKENLRISRINIGIQEEIDHTMHGDTYYDLLKPAAVFNSPGIENRLDTVLEYPKLRDMVMRKCIEIGISQGLCQPNILQQFCDKTNTSSKHIDSVLANKSAGIAEQAQQQETEMRWNPKKDGNEPML